MLLLLLLLKLFDLISFISPEFRLRNVILNSIRQYNVFRTEDFNSQVAALFGKQRKHKEVF